MIDVRAKGLRAEVLVRDILRKHTGLKWERTPASGALDPKHMMKGDLYIPNSSCRYAVEIKSYADDHLTSSILTHKSPQLIEWWKQSVRQGLQMSKKPLLCYKYNRSKIFAAFEDMPSGHDYNFFFISWNEHEFYTALLEDWLTYEKIQWLS